MTQMAVIESAIRAHLATMNGRLEKIGASLALLEQGDTIAGAQALETLPEVDACIDRIEAGLTDEVGAGFEEIGQQLATLGEECGASLAELQNGFENVAESAEGHASAVAESLAEMSESLNAGMDRLLQSIEEDTDAAERRIAEAMSELEQGLDAFTAAVDRQWLDEVGAVVARSTDTLLASVAEVNAGGDAAVSGIVSGIDDLLGQIESILDVLEALRPAFDAVSLVA